MLHNTWYMAHRTLYVVRGRCGLVPATRYLVAGTWHLVRCSLYLVPGAWYLVVGACKYEYWKDCLSFKSKIPDHELTQAADVLSCSADTLGQHCES